MLFMEPQTHIIGCATARRGPSHRGREGIEGIELNQVCNPAFRSLSAVDA